MIGPVAFDIYCYAPDELGAFPCKQNEMSEYCLRNGKCPYASAAPVSVDYVVQRDISILGILKAKALFWLDQIYYRIKWRIIPGSAFRDLSEADEDLDNDPVFLTWATIKPVEVYEFWQWVKEVETAAAELGEGVIDEDLNGEESVSEGSVV